MQINNINIAQALIAAGADLDIKNKHKKTPLSVAKLYKNDELEDLIKKIQKKKIKRAKLQDLIDQFLPYLNKISEEEEEEEEVKKKASKITNNKKQEISSNENNNIQKEDSYSTSKLKSPINIDNSSSENISIETYQFILDSLSQLRARVDNLSNANNSNDNSNSNNNNNNNYEDEGEDEYIDEETFNSICNYIKQISSRISNLESDSTNNNSKEQPKENFKSLSDVLDGIRNLNARISHIDSHPETIQESRADNVIARESAAKQEITINGENILKNENIEQSDDVGNDQNVNLIDKSSPTQSTNVAQNIGNHDIDKIDVDTIKEEFDFDDDDEVESILIGSGACCDVCGDPAIKMCNVCHHKFCQICIDSTKHIEYHLELDDE